MKSLQHIQEGFFQNTRSGFDSYKQKICKDIVDNLLGDIGVSNSSKQVYVAGAHQISSKKTKIINKVFKKYYNSTKLLRITFDFGDPGVCAFIILKENPETGGKDNVFLRITGLKNDVLKDLSDILKVE